MKASQPSATEHGESNVTIDALMTLAKAIIGENIRAARKEKGWTQETLSRKAKVSVNYLSAVERGKVNVTIDTLALIAKALKIPLEQLFRGVN